MTAIPKTGMLREWVELYAPTTEAPDEAHLGVALATISAALGWKAHLPWAGGESLEPVTLNVILTGASATARKTTVANSAEGLVRRALNGTPDDAIGLRVRQMSHASDAGLIELLAPSSNDQAQEWEQRPPPGTLLVWDEFGSILGQPNDHKHLDWHGRLRKAVMAATGGRQGGIQTRALKLPPGRCALAIIGTMTRAELEQRLSIGLVREGFMGRFLLIGTHSKPLAEHRYLAFPPIQTPAWQERRNRLAGWLHDLAQSREVIGDTFAIFSDEARALRESWYVPIRVALDRNAEAGDERDVATRDFYGRIQTVAVKIALIAAVAEWSPPTSLTQLRIQAEHAQYGIDIANEVMRDLRALTGEAGPDHDRDKYKKRVTTYLASRPGQRITRSKLLDDNRSTLFKRDECWNIIQELRDDSTVTIDVDKSTPVQAYVVTLVS